MYIQSALLMGLFEIAHYKSTITIRLDSDVLAWIKKRGARYQARINAILRMYVESQSAAKS